MCIPCYEAVLKEEHQRKLEYDKATIYICRAPSITDIPHLQNSLYDMSEDGTGKEDSDPEFVQVNANAICLKLFEAVLNGLL